MKQPRARPVEPVCLPESPTITIGVGILPARQARPGISESQVLADAMKGRGLKCPRTLMQHNSCRMQHMLVQHMLYPRRPGDCDV